MKEEVTEEEVAKVVGAPSSVTVNECLQALAAKNSAAALEAFHKALKGGSEPKVFLLLLIAKVRGVLLVRFAPEIKKELSEQFSETDIGLLTTLAADKESGIKAAVLAELITALLEMNRAPIPAIPFELALYRVFEF